MSPTKKPRKPAKGSEQISTRWLAGLERVCRDCGATMPNLARDVGEIRRYADGTGWIRCMDCGWGGKCVALRSRLRPARRERDQDG